MTVLCSQQATNWREGRRLRAWELFQEGWPQQSIAEALGVSKGAVSQWLSRVKAQGPQALRHCKPPGGQPKLAHQQRLQLLELLAQEPPALGFHAARFLRHLTTYISVRLLVIWNGNPIHRCQKVKAFLASPAGQGFYLEELPAYAPELNPDEGVWNYLKRVELKNVVCQHLGQLSYELGKAIKRLRQKPHIIRACAAQAGLV